MLTLFEYSGELKKKEKKVNQDICSLELQFLDSSTITNGYKTPSENCATMVRIPCKKSLYNDFIKLQLKDVN